MNRNINIDLLTTVSSFVLLYDAMLYKRVVLRRSRVLILGRESGLLLFVVALVSVRL